MTKTILALFALVAFAFGADASGKWKAQMPGRGGETRETTFNFKVEGNKLTGTMEGPRGPVDIQDGKVDGDNISFSVVRKFQDNEFKMDYKGKISGDEMKLSIDFNGNTREVVAKRAN